MQCGAIGLIKPVARVKGEQLDFCTFRKVSRFVEHKATRSNASLDRHREQRSTSTAAQQVLPADAASVALGAARLSAGVGRRIGTNHVYGGLAYLVVLALVAQYVLSSGHSARARLLVAGAYGLTLIAGYLLPRFALAVLLAQVAVGIALILAYRWEHPKSSLL